MADTKTKVEAPEKTSPPPVSMEQTVEPEKDAGPARPQVQRVVDTLNAAPTSPTPCQHAPPTCLPAPNREPVHLAGPGRRHRSSSRWATSVQASLWQNPCLAWTLQ